MTSTMKGCGFILAILFAILGCLFMAVSLNERYRFPVPALFFLAGIGLFMGTTIILLLVTILHYIENITTDDKIDR